MYIHSCIMLSNPVYIISSVFPQICALEAGRTYNTEQASRNCGTSNCEEDDYSQETSGILARRTFEVDIV